MVQYRHKQQLLEEYLRDLRAKYSSGTTEQSDNTFLIAKLRSAVGAREISKLSEVQIRKRSIHKANTHFPAKALPRAAATSLNDSYFNMSNSLAPRRLGPSSS